jgi:ABC-2 type transport system ATP-binding protein
MAVIEVEKLTKIYRTFKRKEGLRGALINLFYREYEEICAVDDVTFTIEPGESVGYIGPNGAGKSTTIKMLTGILIPTSGNLKVNGFVPHRQRRDYTRHIGVVFGQRTQLWWDIPVIESFKLLRKVYQIPLAEFNERMDKFKELLDLDPFLMTPVRKLSLGQRMRCDLVASLLHNPRILFLDEPTIGLDVIAKLRIREFLSKINGEMGITMILTTHDLNEIEELCKRLLIIDHGKIIYDGNLHGLRQKFMFDRCVTFQLTEDIAFEELQKKFDFNGSVKLEKLDALRLRLEFSRVAFNPAAIIERVLKQVQVHDIAIEEPSIEDIVGHIYSNGV